MLAPFIITAAAAAAVLALPQGTPTTGFLPSGPYAPNTTITYHIPGTKYHSCTTVISQDIIESFVCTPLKGSEISIGKQPEGICTFALFEGTKSCDVFGDGENKKAFSIEKGSGGEVCVTNDKFDVLAVNGMASGIWACG